jgi:hypothetical protein
LLAARGGDHIAELRDLDRQACTAIPSGRIASLIALAIAAGAPR